MASVNKVIVLGNCTRDPEVRYTADGSAIASLSLATNRTWKNAAGEKQEEVEFHRCTFFGRTAEVVGEYVKKGDPLYVEGRLKTRKWQDKETGADRYATEIVVDSMQLLGSKKDGRGERGGGSDFETPEPAPRKDQRGAPPQRQTTGRPASIADMDDDIPF